MARAATTVLPAGSDEQHPMSEAEPQPAVPKPKTPLRLLLLLCAVLTALQTYRVNTTPSVEASRMHWTISVTYGWPWVYKSETENVPAGMKVQEFYSQALLGNIAVCTMLVLAAPLVAVWVGRIITC
jgi:hypothetical protein